MSSMLEQAIIDATTLREAALKSAEQAIIEKYAPQIKDAVEHLLENNGSQPSMGVGSFVKHLESNQTGHIRSIDEDGYQVEGIDGQVFLAEADELEETAVLQEEEMGGNIASVATSQAVEAPIASAPASVVDPNAEAELSMEFEFDPSDFEIDLGSIQQQAQADPDSAGETPISTSELLDDLTNEPEIETDENTIDAELELQEVADLVSEILSEEEEVIEEELVVDTSQQKHGWTVTDVGTRTYDQELSLARLQGTEAKKENEILNKALEDIKETMKNNKKDTLQIIDVVKQLKEKLDETIISNARLVYMNKTLSDASLNERQKHKIVEAIATANSAEEAKTLHETLTATVGSSSKTVPKSLSESVNRKSNLSSMMPRRNDNVVTESLSFADRMKKLAGIN
jgi:hypothetical protein